MCSSKLNGKLSKQVSINVGTKQRCNLSPSSCNLFKNDIPHTLLNSNMDPIKMSGTEVLLLMYADDIIILSQSANGLQHAHILKCDMIFYIIHFKRELLSLNVSENEQDL